MWIQEFFNTALYGYSADGATSAFILHGVNSIAAAAAAVVL